MPKILLVEDDQELAVSVQENLTSEGFKVEISATGADAWHRLECFAYDVIVLDWELPDASGVELCMRYRQRGGSTPVLMMTGRDSINSKVDGFSAGVDDYVTKPVHPLELISRIRALMRRPEAFVSDTITWRHITLNTKNRSVLKCGVETKMQPTEFNLLLFFLQHPDEVLSTEKLLQNCWTAEESVSAESIYSCLRRIRRKLDIDGEPSLIKTVHSAGYCLSSTTVSQYAQAEG